MAGYIGAKVGTVTANAADIKGDISATDTTPEIVLKNTSEEDIEGGREGKITFKGEQSGGEESTLAQIESAHDGTSDDQKGDLIFKTNDGSDGASPTEAMRITSQQRLGIGTNDPTELLTVRGAAHFGKAAIETSADTPVIIKSDTDHLALHLEENSGAESWQIGVDADGDLGFHNSGAAGASVTFDDSGNVGIGDTAPDNVLNVKESALSGRSASNGNTSMTLEHATDTGIQFFSATQTQLRFGDAASTGAGSIIYEHSSDKLRLNTGALLTFEDGGTERMRIDSSGNVLVGSTSSNPSGDGNQGISLDADGHADFSTHVSTQVLDLNRLSDGSIVVFRSGNVPEGSVSISGTTTSFNGGHLSRWSQLTDGSEDTSIVKGTVMTNLDQMAVWSHEAVAATYYEEGDELPEGVSIGDEKTPAKDAYTEDNEQLNCMAVSSVEGDPNVAGVFVNWDHDDDDFNDMNVAMTGDMVIRIAKGVTVARGDLLMSAGDGTAKPQGDDIVRSKTIAKVISTNVSHTYDDESYLVPCVLMAC